MIAAESSRSAQITEWTNAPDESNKMRAHFASRELLWRDKLASSKQDFETQYTQLMQLRDQQRRTYEALQKMTASYEDQLKKTATTDKSTTQKDYDLFVLQQDMDAMTTERDWHIARANSLAEAAAHLEQATMPRASVDKMCEEAVNIAATQFTEEIEYLTSTNAANI